MMTESEAAKNWCPFGRVVFTPDPGTLPLHQTAFNRVHQGESDIMLPNASKCVGSNCMAWRWVGPIEPPYLERRYRWTGGEPRPEDVPDTWERVEADEYGYNWFEPDDEWEARKAQQAKEWPARRRGFCGLAGQP